MREAQYNQERLTPSAATSYAKSMAGENGGSQEQGSNVVSVTEKRGWLGRRKTVIKKQEAKPQPQEKQSQSKPETSSTNEREPIKGKLSVFDAFNKLFLIKLDHISDKNLATKATGFAAMAANNFQGKDEVALAEEYANWVTDASSSEEEQSISGFAQIIILQAVRDKKIPTEQFNWIVKQVNAGVPVESVRPPEQPKPIVTEAEDVVDLEKVPPTLTPLVKTVVALVETVEDDDKRKELSRDDLKDTFKDLLSGNDAVGVSKEEALLRRIGMITVLAAVADKGQSTYEFEQEAHAEVTSKPNRQRLRQWKRSLKIPLHHRISTHTKIFHQNSKELLRVLQGAILPSAGKSR